MKTLRFPLWGNVQRTKGLIITTLMLITCSITAQQGINYKALIKDNSGNIITTFIEIQFNVLEASPTGTVIFSRAQTVTPDTNGLIILDIASGPNSPSIGDFTTIDWASNTHFLNVQINTGAGFVDLGTTEFMAVPYALHANTATTAANVTGLETIDEGNGIGVRLVGQDPDNYGNIGFSAVDLSYSFEPSTTRGATGAFSISTGRATTASGNFSTAMGGWGSIASGSNSTAMGSFTIASGGFSTAFGNSTTAPSFAETVVGSYNTDYTPIETSNWDTTDRLFVVGNGADSSNKSNALTILKNGTITAPSFDMANITDNKALITKEYGDANYNPSGLEAIDESNGIGWRLLGRDPANYGNIGLEATDLSNNNSASTTRGATGSYAIAMGQFTTASGSRSTAMGTSTTASGFASTAMGDGTIASGNYSTALGFRTTASSFASTAIGRNNVGGGNATSWVATDKLFEIGNGTSNFNKKNAFTVLKNGKVGISTATPTVQLQITGGGDANLNDGSGFLLIGNETGANIVMDNNEIMARTNGVASTLFLQHSGGQVWVNGSLVHSSDRRLKKDIVNLPYGLKEVLQLQPKAYNWKNREQTNKSLGLIAQEVQSILKEIVLMDDDENKTLSINYTELIPILINAIKEQQKIITNSELRITNYESEVSSLQSTVNTQDSKIEALSSLNKRIEKLEVLLIAKSEKLIVKNTKIQKLKNK